MKLDSDTAWPQYKEATRETPDHARNIWVVFVMAFGSGITVMFGAWLIALGAGTDKGTALVLGGVATLVVWFIWLLRSDAVIWTIETVTGHDVNRDGSIGEPQGTMTQITLPTGPNSMKIKEQPYSPALLSDWATAAWNRGSLSFATWRDRFALPDGTKGDERYRSFRDWLQEQGYIEEVGGNVGVRVRWKNPEAVQFIGGLAHMDTPLLTDGQTENSPHTG